MKRLLAVGITGALVSGLAFTAFAQTHSANKEISTAHAHAVMAQGASSIAMAHTHLQHVINCLVGPDGQGYDASAGNPCKGQGNGALPDSTAKHALHGELEQALASAQAGLKSDTLTTAQSDAGKAASTLKKAGGSATAKTSSAAW